MMEKYDFYQLIDGRESHERFFALFNKINQESSEWFVNHVRNKVNEVKLGLIENESITQQYTSYQNQALIDTIASEIPFAYVFDFVAGDSKNELQKFLEELNKQSAVFGRRMENVRRRLEEFEGDKESAFLSFKDKL